MGGRELGRGRIRLADFLYSDHGAASLCSTSLIRAKALSFMEKGGGAGGGDMRADGGMDRDTNIGCG